MNRHRLPVIVAALLFTVSGAQAQNFFERLFGLVPSRPQPPAYNQPPPAAPAPSPAQEGAVPDEGRRAPAAPVQAKPSFIKPPSEESVLGRDLKQNGTSGSLRLDRAAGGDLRVRMTVLGRRAAQSVDTCTAVVGAEGGVALTSLGRPEGTPRYQLSDPTCPLQLDIVDEAVLVKSGTEVCTFANAGCQADPSGMWGPDPAQLVSRARDYEAARASADKAVRDNYKVLTQRAKPEAVRPIVAEQAAFSADREMLCRSYAREGTTSFCNAKYSEARALALGVRLGNTTPVSQSAETRSRRGRGTPDPYSLPSTDELTQRPPDDE